MIVVAIVLAGGASTRFGTDKLASELDGRPLLHHALERAAEAADRIVLVLAPDAGVPALRPSMALPAARARLGADRRSLRALLDELGAVTVPAAEWRLLDPSAATLA